MNYYNEIKNEFINNEVNKRVKQYSINRSDLDTYYRVGKILKEAGKHYGDNIITDYSNKLTKELGRGYSKRNLWLMIKFYELREKMQTLSAHLSWSHYCELLSLKSLKEIEYYIKLVELKGLSVRELRNSIQNNEYQRLPESTREKIANNNQVKLIDFVKNPIRIKNGSNYNIFSEKILQKLILEDIEFFMKELGNNFSFIGSEYKIKIGDTFNYIDLLLFNIEYNCYVVIELKVTELKKEHTGQIMTYMNYIDENIKTINQNKTIGIIICREDNHYVIKYC